MALVTPVHDVVLMHGTGTVHSCMRTTVAGAHDIKRVTKTLADVARAVLT